MIMYHELRSRINSLSVPEVQIETREERRGVMALQNVHVFTCHRPFPGNWPIWKIAAVPDIIHGPVLHPTGTVCPKF